MNRHRPRKPRQDGAGIQFLSEWRNHVEYLEQQVLRGRSRPILKVTPVWEGPTGCPMCDGEMGADARTRLECLMRNGGRRAHRLRAMVTRLDERYREVTTEYDPRRSVPWWQRRAPWG